VNEYVWLRNVGGGELMIVLLAAAIVFRQHLPAIARWLGLRRG
jgi:hypothetical protein